MAKTTFTSGPWQVSLHAVSKKGYARVSGSGWSGLAKVVVRMEHQNIDERSEEGVANARLIAAAPDMYEVLEQAYQKFAAFGFQWEGRETPEGQHLLAKMAEVLRKAEGKEEVSDATN